MIICKSPQEIKKMQEAAHIVADVLLKIEQVVEPGMTTGHLDKLAEKIILKSGGIPAFKGYKGRISSIPFPSSICASINHEVVHGIPGPRKIEAGDLVSIDVGVELNGYFGDAARSYLIGEVDEVTRQLWEATREALDLSIEHCFAGRRLSDLSHSIEQRAKRSGFSVVKDFVGHGIGTKMHEDPQILNYGPPGQGPKLKPGMVLAIEPMLNIGRSAVKVLDDGWTVVTQDGSTSCHFEDMVAITDGKPLVLSRV
ncbi:MAG: type I methionyl aminopeptidase [Actinomycetota bacterium]|nr:type I methionyl aminopeptidase [Actinomycetota bacterium]